MNYHVYPAVEKHLHNLSGSECRCGGSPIFIDEDTGLPWPDGGYLMSHDAIGEVVDGPGAWNLDEEHDEVIA